MFGLSIIGESLFALEATRSDPKIQQALRIAIAIGEDAAFAYQLPIVPTQIENGRDAYRAMIQPSLARDEALQYARRSLELSMADCQISQGAVLIRAEQAYCATALLGGGSECDRTLAIDVPAERLYDSFRSQVPKPNPQGYWL